MRRRSLGIGTSIAAFAIYLTCVIAYTFCPFPVTAEALSEFRSWPILADLSPSLVPFRTISAAVGLPWPESIRQVGGNLALLLPLGAALPLLHQRFEMLGKTMLAGVSASLAVEAMQGIFSLLLGYRYKVVDIDDVILNTAGVLLGYLLYRFIRAVAPGVIAWLRGESTSDSRRPNFRATALCADEGELAADPEATDLPTAP
ncbi:MAG: VanZ family protein [Coriobacteriia bacterium]